MADSYTHLSNFLSNLKEIPSVCLNYLTVLLSLTFFRLSIEIIPNEPGHEAGIPSSARCQNPYHPLLFVEGHLGVPQPTLFRAYMIASKLITRDFLRISSNEMARALVLTTSILLMANPAHNTALNHRKRLIHAFSSILSCTSELKFTACLLDNKQASKSSILWHHRRWIIRYMSHQPPLPPCSSLLDSLNGLNIPLQDLHLEFKLVSRAAEVYPRNYHAWLHRYLCAECLITQCSNNVPEAYNLLHLELENSRRWVELHVSDHTAAHYLSRLVLMSQSLPEYHSLVQSAFVQSNLSSYHPTSIESTPLVSHALTLLTAYPIHESLWSYLRLACMVETQIAQWVFVAIIGTEVDDASKDGLPVLSCSSIKGRMTANARLENLYVIQKHAFRFIVWTLLSVSLDRTRSSIIFH
ncbi:hypothetical protein BU17DRAFT_50479 [Hysterangium stoloniferum]|nr:hypothetical protein BU17DRAFT_50479 [Hysterangium stoloniferum]